MFVPVHYCTYKWYAIQLDKAHTPEMATSDDLRDADVALQGYEVIRFKPENQGYFEAVRSLVERIDREIAEAANDFWTFAAELPVRKTIPKEDLPF